MLVRVAGVQWMVSREEGPIFIFIFWGLPAPPQVACWLVL